VASLPPVAQGPVKGVHKDRNGVWGSWEGGEFWHGTSLKSLEVELPEVELHNKAVTDCVFPFADEGLTWKPLPPRMALMWEQSEWEQKRAKAKRNREEEETE
jgi:hypothetical protein